MFNARYFEYKKQMESSYVRNEQPSKAPTRLRRAIDNAEDLSTLELNFKAFKFDCTVFSLALIFFFFFGLFVVFYWWNNRIQNDVKNELCKMRLALCDLEADLEKNSCTEYRMRKGQELPSLINKVTTWNDVARSCPEFSW